MSRTTGTKTLTRSTETRAKRAIPRNGTNAPADLAARGVEEAPAGMLVERVTKKELIERVTAASGLKRREAKVAMEATLEALGAALARGEELSLQGLGKLKVNRVQEQPSANVYICKLRRPKASYDA